LKENSKRSARKWLVNKTNIYVLTAVIPLLGSSKEISVLIAIKRIGNVPNADSSLQHRYRLTNASNAMKNAIF
jgi:hypothetical protein